MEKLILDGTTLHEIANKTPTASVTATMLALRERARDSLNLSKTKHLLTSQGEKIVDNDYIQFWKDLQDAGIGSIVYGRRGKPNRFNWHYNLKTVAKSMIEGEDAEVNEFVSKRSKNETKKRKRRTRLSVPIETPKVEEKVKTETADRLLYVPLRKEFHVALRIPGDMSMDEAETLSQALKRAINTF